MEQTGGKKPDSTAKKYYSQEMTSQWPLYTEEERSALFFSLDKEGKADLINSLSDSDQEELLQRLSEQHLRELFSEMEPDDIVDILQSIDHDIRRAAWNSLHDSVKKETLFLLRFDEDDAAGLMTPRFIAVRSSISVEQAIQFLRKNARDVETIYYLYIIDELKRLIGVCSLKDLLCAENEKKVSTIMTHDVISVREDTDQEEVAKILEDYDYIALPVVDQNNVLLGIVTFDDIIDVIREEQTEDVYKMGAMQGDTERYLDTSVWGLVKKRVIWLIILLLVGTITTNVVNMYQDAVLAMAFLFIFMPVITQTGGNAGSQSATLMIRGLATGEIHFRDIGNVMVREVAVGIIMGLITGGVIILRSYLLPPGIELMQAITVGCSLIFVVLFSSLIGAVSPLIIHRLGFDPTVMSAPLMATVIDVCGLTIYFEIAKGFSLFLPI